jgi:hypothetical protein
VKQPSRQQLRAAIRLLARGCESFWVSCVTCLTCVFWFRQDACGCGSNHRPPHYPQPACQTTVATNCPTCHYASWDYVFAARCCGRHLPPQQPQQPVPLASLPLCLWIIYYTCQAPLLVHIHIHTYIHMCVCVCVRVFVCVCVCAFVKLYIYI